MKILSIDVSIPSTGAIGSIATVRTKVRKAFFWSIEERKVYLCFTAGFIAGGMWIEESTGLKPSEEIMTAINYAARAKMIAEISNKNTS